MRQFLSLAFCLLIACGCAKDKVLSPIDQYDAELNKSVKKSWHQILQQVDQTQLKPGTVVVCFRLWRDGQISDARVIKNTTGVPEALAVERAIMIQTNYKPWPDSVVELVHSNYRWVTFTFNYK